MKWASQKEPGTKQQAGIKVESDMQEVALSKQHLNSKSHIYQNTFLKWMKQEFLEILRSLLLVSLSWTCFGVVF